MMMNIGWIGINKTQTLAKMPKHPNDHAKKYEGFKDNQMGSVTTSFGV